MPADPLSPSSVPVPSPTITGVVSPEADVPTETTVRDPPNRGQPQSPTLQEVPTEPEPPPSSPPPTEVGDLTTDPTVTIPQSFNQNVPPPPPPTAKAVTSLTLAPRTEPGPIRVPPKILNPADAARAGAPNEPPPGREGGIKGRKPPPVQEVLGADARAQLIALQRTQALGSASAASAAEMTPAERAAAEARLEDLRRRQAPMTPAESQALRMAQLRAEQTPSKAQPKTPGRRESPPRDRERDRDRRRRG